MQPSGLSLSVTIERTGSAFKQAFVNGPIEVVYDDALYLPRRIADHSPTLDI